MRRMLAVLAIASLGLAPIGAQAQQRAPAPAPAAPQSAELDSTKVLVIGAGAVVGALILGGPMNMRGVLGLVAGGLLANWWYNERNAPPALDPTKKSL